MELPTVIGRASFSDRFGVIETVDASELEDFEFSPSFVEVVEADLIGAVRKVLRRLKWVKDGRGVRVTVVEYENGEHGIQVTVGCKHAELVTTNFELVRTK